MRSNEAASMPHRACRQHRVQTLLEAAVVGLQARDRVVVSPLLIIMALDQGVPDPVDHLALKLSRSRE
jgi:hypothetical protein